MATLQDIKTEITSKSYVIDIAYDVRKSGQDDQNYEERNLLVIIDNGDDTSSLIKLTIAIKDDLAYYINNSIDDYAPTTLRDIVTAYLDAQVDAISVLRGYTDLQLLNGSLGATVKVFREDGAGKVEQASYFLEPDGAGGITFTELSNFTNSI